ncbi:MAG: hypothetical protein ABR906_12005 [Terracidiphilus sp.]|jgi:hypothetical protein
MSKGPYTKPGRLADVLALIQVLALDPDTRRSIDGITKELQGSPTSAKDWLEVAKEHREFFRVDSGSGHPLSLVARYVLPYGDEAKRPQLPTDFTSQLLQTAITLHDRQVAASEWWWKTLIPIASTVLGGILALAGVWLTNHSPK